MLPLLNLGQVGNWGHLWEFGRLGNYLCLQILELLAEGANMYGTQFDCVVSIILASIPKWQRRGQFRDVTWPKNGVEEEPFCKSFSTIRQHYFSRQENVNRIRKSAAAAVDSSHDGHIVSALM
jgi:hypothetical protein